MPAPFLPLSLLALERCVRRTRAKLPGGWGLFAIALGFSLVACFPEMAYLDGLLVLAWSLLRFFQLGKQQWHFAGKIIGGGILALAVTLPATLPFLQYLSMTEGVTHRLAATLGLQAPHYAMLLMPALYGPPFWAQRYALWDTFVGGYLDLALVLLMLLGMLQPGLREPRLRMMLTAWIMLALLKVSAAPLATSLLNHLPMMRMVQFFRYGQLGIDMAAVVLAAFAIDAWDRGRTPSRLSILLAALTGLLLCAAALAAARPTILSLLRVPSYPWFLLGSLGWAALVAALLLGTMAGPAGPARRIVLTSMVVVNAALLFSVPLSAGARNRALDLDGIAFLRAHLGLQRAYTMGSLGPNYGSFFGIATIDYNSVMVPRIWIDYLHRHLDPGTDPALFNGSYPQPPSGDTLRDAMFHQNEAAFAAIGVRYLVRPAGPVLRLRPFGPWKTVTAQPLADGQSVQAIIPGASLREGRVRELELVDGLYNRPADGTLVLRICQPDRCRAATASLAQAIDNTALTMRLDEPLLLRPGTDVTMTLRRHGGISPVAVWFNDTGPLISLDYISLDGDPAPVYDGSRMRIDEVPGTAAYAETPDCRLAPYDRDHMTAVCSAPSNLHRLELDYPGWQAKVNGRPVPITRTGEIFQSVALPAGRSVITFHYRPPGEIVAWVIGALALLAAAGMGLVGRHRQPGIVQQKAVDGVLTSCPAAAAVQD